ncbi:hypothetical protein B0H63DRAFT_565150 [Podospora didyma]|uniref:Heterokaryon incompatibility domain-containing protein n=1 Tax=Podospora didyma TaxID=330526 RepID=A0AAE0K2N9_9PEZI|nr:hypothetical protein B0H63DRAFT_565150 [Podospora didyma]
MREYVLDDADSLLAFFGLSYCWGAPDRSHMLATNNSSLAISMSLRRGLDELADLEEFDGARFWIDQTCVNQHDLAESFHQSYNRGWDLAETLHTFGLTRPDGSRTLDFIKAPYLRDCIITTSGLVALGLPNANDGAWEDLKHIIDNPWFSRMWVLQEAALSRVAPSVVHAGRRRTLEGVLWAGAWLWQSSGPRIFLGFEHYAVSNVYTMFIIVESAIPWRIEPLLMGTDKFGASDMRDKVIALLGLAAPESLPRNWVPDYHRSSTADVYRDVSRAVVEETGQLLIFEGINYGCDPAYDTPPGMPS